MTDTGDPSNRQPRSAPEGWESELPKKARRAACAIM